MTNMDLEDNEGYREIGGSDGKSGDNSNNDSPQGDLVRISAKDPSLSLPELSEICSQGEYQPTCDYSPYKHSLTIRRGYSRHQSVRLRD